MEDEIPVPKKYRGPTKLCTVPEDKINVKWNVTGQPIGAGSVLLSSFVGPLAREMVPYTLTDWRRLLDGLKAALWKTVQVYVLYNLISFFYFP